MLENFIGNSINKGIGKYAGGNLGNLFLKMMYTNSLKLRTRECAVYAINKKITSSEKIQEIMYDLMIINYIWIIPNGRAEYKRALKSPINMVMSFFGEDDMVTEWKNKADSVFDKFGTYITIGNETLLNACVENNLLIKSKAERILKKVKRKTLHEYCSVSLEKHSLGNTLIDIFISNEDQVPSYFNNKYKNFDILGNVSSRGVAQAINWHE